MPAAEKTGGRGPIKRAALHPYFMRAAVARAAGDRKPRHRADGGQRLPPEAEGGDGGEIILPTRMGKLGGGVALHREAEIVCTHPLPVILHQDQIRAAACGGDRDAVRVGIERVFHQLLHRAGRTFHHLARGDAVHGAFGQTADFGLRFGHGVILAFRQGEAQNGARYPQIRPHPKCASHISTPQQMRGRLSPRGGDERKGERYFAEAGCFAVGLVSAGVPATTMVSFAGLNRRLAARRASSSVMALISALRLAT